MARDRASRTRRQLLESGLTLAGLGLLAGCGIPLGPSDQRGELYRVGLLQHLAAAIGAPTLEAFRQGLHEHGYIEGQNVILEARYTGGGMIACLSWRRNSSACMSTSS